MKNTYNPVNAIQGRGVETGLNLQAQDKLTENQMVARM
jgi:hypothetical protein